MVSRATKHRILRRDGRRCGLHMGGCQRPIDKGGECNVDHIIPKALFTMLAKDRANEFEADWNYQPMHIACHDEKRDRLSGRELSELEMAVTVGTQTPDNWPKLKPRWDVHLSGDGDQLGCAGESLSSVLGE